MHTVLLAGTSHPGLAQAVSTELSLPLGSLTIERFPDGELDISLEAEVRGASVFVVQSLHAPVGEHLLELALISDCCRRAGARLVTAVIPYLGYARHDRRVSGREPLGARVVAEQIAAGGIDRVLCVDLHSRAVEGCFPRPVEHVDAIPLLVEHVRPLIRPPAVVVSPDLGAVKRAEALARPLGLPVAVVHKHRLSSQKVQAQGVVGEVAGRQVVVVDDLISTGGTLAEAVKTVVAHGARVPVIVAASHGLFVGSAAEQLKTLPLDRVIVTDSVPPPRGLEIPPFTLERVSSAAAIAQVIRRLERPASSPSN